MSQSSPRALSLRTRLVLLVSILLLATLVPLLAVTFIEVRATLLAAGGARAQESANTLGDLVAQSARQRWLDVRRVAAMPAIRAYLLHPSPATEADARREMRSLVSPLQQNLIELWDASGQRVLALAEPAEAEQLLGTGIAPTTGTHPLRRVGTRSTQVVAAAVSRDPSAGDARPSDIAGYLGSQRMSLTPSANADGFRRLVGAHASFGLGNRTADVWSDLDKFVSAPPYRTDAAGVSQFTAADGTPMVAAVALIADTPYAVSVEFPRALIVAPAAKFVGRLALGGGVLLVVGVGLTVLVTRQISTPIAALTEAAERIAAGDYSSRVDVGRRDEVGRLAVAFNRMTEQVQSDQQAQARSIRLEEENRRAQEASRLKSEFLANMSHELRTPLNSIIGFAELLHDEQVPRDSPEFKEFLHDILTSGRHLLQLINDVLDLAKVESGRFEFHPEKVDIGRTVGEVLNLMRTSAASKQLRVESEIDPGVGIVTIDPGRFKQVLYNYLSNAIKFTPPDGRVVVRAAADGSDGFRVEVEDTGIGIAAEDLGRLFIEFQQLEPGAAKRHQGTGLGLALTKRLVEAQGGTVGVRSVPGKGSVFFATFPREASHGTAEAAPGDFPGADAGDRPGKVLIVDDDPGSLRLMAASLAQLGYGSVSVATAAEGLRQAAIAAPAAVILDVVMPEMNGFEFLARFRAMPNCQGAPVIIWTVQDLLPAEHERLRASAQGILSKGQDAAFSVVRELRRMLPPARPA